MNKIITQNQNVTFGLFCFELAHQEYKGKLSSLAKAIRLKQEGLYSNLQEPNTKLNKVISDVFLKLPLNRGGLKWL